MKYKLVLVVGFVLISIIVLIGVDRTPYFTNSSDKNIKEEAFDFTCKVKRQSATKNDLLVLDFDFFDMKIGIVRQLIIIPIVNQKDTLKLISSYSDRYFFIYPENVKRLDMIIKYKIDSLGSESLRTKRYFDLKKTYTYQFKF